MKSPLAWTVFTLVVLVLALAAASRLWTEVLWFRQLGYLNVFTTQWIARIALFAVGAVVMGGIVWASMWIAYRGRPTFVPTSDSEQVVSRYRSQFDPVRRPAMIVVPVLIGLFAGGNAANQWENVLQFLNSEPFGERDPQWNLDLSFYVFQLPTIRFAVSFLMGAVAIGLVAAVVLHYLYGGIQAGVGGLKGGWSKAARVQLGLTAAVVCLLVAAQYMLDRYSMVSAVGSNWDGALYTAVHANMPAKLIMAFIAVFVAVLFAVAAWKGDWKLPVTGLGLMVLSAAVVGWAYPALIQQFSVKPSQMDKEETYIQRNIDATRMAFGLEDVEPEQYDAETDAEPGALRQDADSTASIRLLDPTVVSPTFRQKEQNKQYYDFPSVLAVDRYEVNGEKRDTVIAVRDLKLSGIGEASANWVNQHTVYTHGYGVVAAYGNTTDEQGLPMFYEGGIPTQGDLAIEEPRVYFGTTSPDYSIVGGSSSDKPVELDYSSDEAGDDGQVWTTYDGEGGPNVGSALNKILYAIRFSSTNILFSDNIRPESQILYDRDPYTRVQKVAPYLTLDERVYPAVVDGKLVWIVDGYTTSDAIPYAQHQALDTTTVDSITALSGVAGINAVGSQQVNYLRNSVKAVVDAYNGSVTLYAWEPDEPVLKVWASIYSNNLTPISEISGDLMSHLRYPETMFKVQRSVLASYHVTDARSFFNRQDFWKIPSDPTESSQNARQQPPYYLTMKMPTQEEATFSLSSTYVPIGTSDQDIQPLKGFLAVNSETGNQAGVVDEDYGKMRLLSLPQGDSIAGPGQVQNSFVTDAAVKSEIRLLQDQGTEVIYGNLLTLPVGGGLLYVEPLYVQATQGSRFPSLQKVVVGFGGKVGVAGTLTEALNIVFGGDAGAEAGDKDVDKDPDIDLDGDGSDDETPPDGSASPQPSASTAPSPSPSASASATPTPPSGGGNVDEAIDSLLEAIDAADLAMRAGDWEAYAEAQKNLQAAREALEGARAQGAT
ncbi:MAG: UPF0182 family protein [Bifidobacteriaceae bacterium]|jgi:uncharacterized membrane protein (UPF0182 family)|nr:UPF0182 family protein [Bifidobacteriaceae bacterium]